MNIYIYSSTVIYINTQNNVPIALVTTFPENIDGDEPFRSPITITVSDINHREPLDVTAATISHDPVEAAAVISATATATDATDAVIDPLRVYYTSRWARAATIKK